MPNTEVVRAAFEAYRAQDAETGAALLADDFVFTSPQDDHIDKAAFMERCFPTADRFVHFYGPDELAHEVARAGWSLVEETGVALTGGSTDNRFVKATQD